MGQDKIILPFTFIFSNLKEIEEFSFNLLVENWPNEEKFIIFFIYLHSSLWLMFWGFLFPGKVCIDYARGKYLWFLTVKFVLPPNYL